MCRDQVGVLTLQAPAARCSSGEDLGLQLAAKIERTGNCNGQAVRAMQSAMIASTWPRRSSALRLPEHRPCSACPAGQEEAASGVGIGRMLVTPNHRRRLCGNLALNQFSIMFDGRLPA